MGRMQKGRLTNPQISLVLGLVSPGIKVYTEGFKVLALNRRALGSKSIKQY